MKRPELKFCITFKNLYFFLEKVKKQKSAAAGKGNVFLSLICLGLLYIVRASVILRGIPIIFLSLSIAEVNI